VVTRGEHGGVRGRNVYEQHFNYYTRSYHTRQRG
jgi:hypothetical protein